MKKFLLVLVVSLISLVSNAQFKKSDKILEGSVSYSKSKGTDAEYSVSPSLGIFLSEKFALGVSLGIGEDADGSVTNFGTYGRYYFMSIGKNISAYTQMDISSDNTKLAGVKTSAFSINLGVGVNYFVSKKMAITAHICDLMGYTNQDSNSDFSIGFSGVNNPLSMGQFGLLIKL